MISHTGTESKFGPPYCDVCRVRPVKYVGEACSFCRCKGTAYYRKKRDASSFWAFVWFFIGAMALMMAASSAIGTWMALNVDGFGSHGRVNPPAYAGLVQPRGGMTLSAPANNLGETDGR